MVLLQRLLGMNPRELRRSLPLFAYLFLVMAGSVASKAARDALFLERYRAADLPFADIAIALFVAVVASVYIRAGERLNSPQPAGGQPCSSCRLRPRLSGGATAPGEENPTPSCSSTCGGILSVLAPAQV
jgi:hypothetical protein